MNMEFFKRDRVPSRVWMGHAPVQKDYGVDGGRTTWWSVTPGCPGAAFALNREALMLYFTKRPEPEGTPLLACIRDAMEMLNLSTGDRDIILLHVLAKLKWMQTKKKRQRLGLSYLHHVMKDITLKSRGKTIPDWEGIEL